MPQNKRAFFQALPISALTDGAIRLIDCAREFDNFGLDEESPE